MDGACEDCTEDDAHPFYEDDYYDEPDYYDDDLDYEEDWNDD